MKIFTAIVIMGGWKRAFSSLGRECKQNGMLESIGGRYIGSKPKNRNPIKALRDKQQEPNSNE